MHFHHDVNGQELSWDLHDFVMKTRTTKMMTMRVT